MVKGKSHRLNSIHKHSTNVEHPQVPSTIHLRIDATSPGGKEMGRSNVELVFEILKRR